MGPLGLLQTRTTQGGGAAAILRGAGSVSPVFLVPGDALGALSRVLGALKDCFIRQGVVWGVVLPEKQFSFSPTSFREATARFALPLVYSSSWVARFIHGSAVWWAAFANSASGGPS